MKIVFEVLDEPNFCPLTFENALGYLLLVVSPVDGKLAMQYAIARKMFIDANPLEHEKLLPVMEALEAVCKSAVEIWNKENS